MLFNSFEFLFLYLPVTLVGFFVFARVSQTGALAWLLAASLIFYSWWRPADLIVLVASTAANFTLGQLIVARRARGEPARWLLGLAILANLALLGWYKYANFFASTAGFTLDQNHLPLGISFFTFTQIAYLVDVHRNPPASRNPLHYGLFVTYFPHLLAGPILHHAEMVPQFRRQDVFRPRWDRLALGLTVVTIGLFKKVVLADSLAPYVETVFTMADKGEVFTFFEAWAGALAYTLQIYFDFSGYCDIAIGLGAMLGIYLPLNFNSPYKALSITDFWRRWHITLSRFLRDYLYIPLGGNRRGPLRRYANLTVTMLLGGLWHGAGWTFIIWGGLHGLYLVIAQAWTAKSPVRLPAPIAWLVTFTSVMVAWVFFRATSLEGALVLLSAMAGRNGIFLPGGLADLLGPLASLATGLGIGFDSSRISYLPSQSVQALMGAMLVIALFAPNVQNLMSRYDIALSVGVAAERRSIRWQPTAPWAIGMAAMLVLVISNLGGPTAFLYFNF